jgi:hypothetical protein
MSRQPKSAPTVDYLGMRRVAGVPAAWLHYAFGFFQRVRSDSEQVFDVTAILL